MAIDIGKLLGQVPNWEGGPTGDTGLDSIRKKYGEGFLVLMNNVRKRYFELVEIDPNNGLLNFVKITIRPDLQSPYPDLCPVMFDYTPSERMQKYGNCMGTPFAPRGYNEFYGYLSDLEEAIKKSKNS